MRYIVMHRANASTEAGEPPTEKLMREMGGLVQSSIASKVFLAGDGLKATSHRVRLVFDKGQVKQTKGPFKGGSGGALQGFSLIQTSSLEEAIGWAKKFAAVLGNDDLIVELGPVVEPWDLGVMPKPANAPLRVLSTHRSLSGKEPTEPPSPEAMAKMGALADEMKAKGVLLRAEGFLPTSEGARVTYAKNKRTVVDGPFAEAKELIAGFCMLELPSKGAALEWADKFAAIIGDIELDVRLVGGSA